MNRAQPIHPAHCQCRACTPACPGQRPKPLRIGLILSGPAIGLAWSLLCLWVAK